MLVILVKRNVGLYIDKLLVMKIKQLVMKYLKPVLK